MGLKYPETMMAFFIFLMGKGCEVLGKRFLNLRITILDLRLIRLYELLLNFIIFNEEF